ncbi:MAG: SOS response-associated peptidase family protein [Parafannyhessea sp.]|uniref:SOS response-associated peptidase family protein n=1 Tax=Parafannyhessea sp. TaxID=2847324 RepID=UPI003F079002
MCHRMSPLLLRELQEGLKYMQVTGHAHVPRRDPSTVVPDAYPGTQVPLFVPDEKDGLTARELTWGFQPKGGGSHGGGPSRPGGSSRLVFNTRIETALEQARTGRGMWAEPIRYGRCLAPVRAFYEWWTQPNPPAAPGGCAADAADGKPATAASRKKTQRPQVRYGLSGHSIFLMACVWEGERFSVVTTRPNASVAPVHNRMPLVLGPGESRIWLGDDWPQLADRSAVPLTAELEPQS